MRTHSAARWSVAIARGILAFAAGGFWVAAADAQATFVGPTLYACASDSPFAALSLGYFHLETFEDHLFNVPGVSADHGGVTSVIFGPSVHDSVDCDDGVVDGSGLLGDSFFISAGAVRFTFSAAALGSLPTHAGVVWTDGGAGVTITFEAFGPGGASLGAIAGDHADSSNNGTTAEDRFYGVVNAPGISAIRISNSGGGLEIDHLQFGGGGVACTGDVDGDEDVDLTDLATLLTHFGTPSGATRAQGDVDSDGDVDLTDLATVLANFGTVCL